MSIVAFVISVLGFATTLALTARRDIIALKPMLVFTYRDDGWHIENVGNGPALDVIFTRRADMNGSLNDDEHTRLPALAKGALFLLRFARHENPHIFLTTYTDADGRKYTSKSEHDVSRIKAGWNGMVRPADPGTLKRWWERPDSAPR